MKFIADMGLSSKTVLWLRTMGHDAIHLREEHLERASDRQIVEKASLENRIILTMDLDFGYLLAISGERLPSVIIFRLSDERSDFVNTRLAEALGRYSPALEEGAILSVGDDTIRVRRLPIWHGMDF